MASVEDSVLSTTPSVAQQPSALKGAIDETENAAAKDEAPGGPSNESSPSADTGVDLGLSRDEGEEGSEDGSGGNDEEDDAKDEEDLDWCPEDHIAEEERKLAEERHAKEGKNPEVEALLDDSRFQQLDQLLHRTGLFTQFLSEQMKEIGQQTDAEASQKSQKPGSKRKAAAPSSSKGGAAKNKRGKKAGGKAAASAVQMEEEEEAEAKKAAEAAATKELLPLMDITLRDYQLTGVKWLISLYKNGLNGILADQMGLGKTCQTIGFLSHLREKGIHGPFLILGPLSTLPNWVAEIERFCPSMPALLYHGSADERAALRQKHMPKGAKVTSSFPAVVTSYEILLRDVKHLQKYQWKYVIVDEGHRLKNFDCQLLRELRTIPAANKLLLTGTPLQNNLAELWSLLNFILPDVFCSLSDFESWFDFSEVGKEGADKALLAQEQRNKVITKLHSLMKPFMLRRTKADVNIGLPGKMEVVMYAAMTNHQKELNDKLLDRSLLQSLQEQAGTGSARSGMTRSLNNLLMQLRKNANHPDLITSGFDPHNITYPTGEELKEQCGKFQLLDRLLQGLFAKGHKVLIFSQMTKMLDLLDHYLDESGILAARLDGSIKWEDRKQSIHQFNNDPNMKVFLLSTRAGGLGINLTAADTVIIYDSDWNPHQDLQAMDRVHRIGQTKPVLVIRLATAHSVEGKMLTKAGNKMALERVVIKKGAFKADDLEEGANPAKDAGSMKADELVELLKADYADGISQSGVVDEKMMERILDRTHITNNAEPPYALEGVGYSVVTNAAGSNVGLLSGVNNKA